MKLRKKDKLRKLLEQKQLIDEKLKQVTALKDQINEAILQQFSIRELDEIEYKDRRYKRQINKKVNWDAEALEQYLVENHTGLSDKIVRVVPRIERFVNEDELAKAINKKRLKTQQVRKFVTTSESRPFIRVYQLNQSTE